MEQDLVSTLEQQLRGLHVPDASGWWPPAFGWWLLAAVVIGVLILAIILLRNRHRASAYKRGAFLELKTIYQRWQNTHSQTTQSQSIRSKAPSEADQTATKDQTYLREVNALLKRALLSGGAEKKIASESGESWSERLRIQSSHRLSDESIAMLTSGLYEPNPQVDVESLHQDVKRWLKHHHQVKQQEQPSHA